MEKIIYTIEGLDCGNCAVKIERHLNKDEHIAHASLDFAAARLYVTYKENAFKLDELISKIKEVNDDKLTIDYAHKAKSEDKVTC